MDLVEQFFEREKQQKILHYRMLNQTVKKGQIVLVGSSLMEQFPIYELMLDFPIGRIVYNRGIGGITTSDLLELLDVCVFDLAPARIFINIGSNDLNDEVDTLDELIDRYTQILVRINTRLPNARLYMLAYYPVNEIDDFGDPIAREGFKHRTNQRLQRANTRLKQLARLFGVAFIDLNAGLLDERMQLKKEFSVEGLHLYPNGYRVIYQALLPYLKEQ